MSPIVLLIVFVAATLVGYKVISQVPSLLHTPLMSGMNALSGITILASLTAATFAMSTGSKIVAILAILLPTVNIVAGLYVTHRMLRMFKEKKTKETSQE